VEESTRQRQDIFELHRCFVGAALGLTTRGWKSIIGTPAQGVGFSFVDRCLIAGRALWFYAGKLVWPITSLIYPRWKSMRGVVAISVSVGCVGGAGRVMAVAATNRKRPDCGRAVLAGTLMPALGFFNVYPFLTASSPTTFHTLPVSD